jgi:hypothetical protein
VMGRATAGPVDQVYDDGDGTKRGHRKQCSRKTRQRSTKFRHVNPRHE